MNKVFCATLTLSTLLFAGHAEAQTYKTELTGGEIIVDSVRRTSDETVLVKGTIVNTGQSQLPLLTSGLTDSDSVVVTFQELKTKKQFEQVRVEGIRVGSKHSPVLFNGQSTKFWARVTAPPKDVQKVTILFGADAAPLDDVTISE